METTKHGVTQKSPSKFVRIMRKEKSKVPLVNNEKWNSSYHRVRPNRTLRITKLMRKFNLREQLASLFQDVSPDQNASMSSKEKKKQDAAMLLQLAKVAEKGSYSDSELYEVLIEIKTKNQFDSNFRVLPLASFRLFKFGLEKAVQEEKKRRLVESFSELGSNEEFSDDAIAIEQHIQTSYCAKSRWLPYSRQLAVNSETFVSPDDEVGSRIARLSNGRLESLLYTVTALTKKYPHCFHAIVEIAESILVSDNRETEIPRFWSRVYDACFDGEEFNSEDSIESFASYDLPLGSGKQLELVL